MTQNKYNGYKLVLPSFIGIYGTIVIIYLLLTFPTYFKLYPILAIITISILVISLVGIYFALKKIEYNPLLDYKQRIANVTQLLPLRLLYIVSLCVCAYTFVFHGYSNYDYSMLKEMPNPELYDTAMYFHPILATPLRNCIQCGCDTISYTYAAIEDVTAAIVEYSETEVPEDVMQELKDNYVTEAERLEEQFEDVKTDVNLHITSIANAEILHVVINYLLKHKYKKAMAQQI